MKHFDAILNNRIVEQPFSEIARLNSISFSLTIPVLPFPTNPSESEQKSLFLGRDFLENDPFLIQREIKAWFHLEKEIEKSCFHLPDYQTHVHVESILDDHSVLTPLNLCDPRVMRTIQNPETALYKFIENHIQIPSISLHLGYSSEQLRINSDSFSGKLRDNHFIPDSAILSRDEVMERLIASLGAFKENSGNAGFAGDLLLEVLRYNSSENGSVCEYLTEPEFIDTIISETGYGLILDTAHLMITAMHKGYPTCTSYVKKFLCNHTLLSAIREIHISVPSTSCGYWYDSHLSFSDTLDRPENRLILDVIYSIVCAKFKADNPTPLVINFETPVKTWYKDLQIIIEHLQSIRSLQNCDSYCNLL